MAYKKIKEENGEYAILINGWEDGIGIDPYSGMGRMLNVDLSNPGEVAVGFGLTSNTIAGGTLGVPIHRAVKYSLGIPSAYFVLDAGSQVFSSTGLNGTFTFLSTSNAVTGATATNQGLVYWIPPSGGSGWLFKFRNGSIDYLAGGSGTWQAGWKPIYSGVNHYALAGQDGAVYFCNGPGIGSILEVEGQVFDPTSSTTYTFTALDSSNLTTTSNALAIPPYDFAQSLAEQGTSLLIGGSQNAIYPWDRLSPSFGYPIFVADPYIKRMVTVNTNVYIFSGNTAGRGRIFITNGSQVNLFYKIPDYLFGEQDPYFEWGDAMWHRGNLIFGFFVNKNSGAGIIASAEVWAIDLETKVFRSLSSISASSGKANATVLIGGVITAVPGMAYLVGWDNSGAAAGLGSSSTAAGIGSFSLHTDLIPVGTLFDKKTFSQIEYKLRSPLLSGESISVTPIIDETAGSALTFNPTPTTGEISGVATVNFEKAQWLKLAVIGIGNNAASGVRLEEIRIR